VELKLAVVTLNFSKAKLKSSKYFVQHICSIKASYNLRRRRHEGTVHCTMPISNSLTSKKRQSSKKLTCEVVLLDNTAFLTTFEHKSAKGKELFDRVCDHLRLTADDRQLFGLQYTAWEDGELNWVENDEEIRSQRSKPYHFQFAVKFYPVFPQRVSQEARVQLCLQIKDLLMRGKFLLPLPVKEHALLDGLFTQLWLSDFNPKLHQRGYVQDKLDRFFVSPCGINSDEEITEAKYEALVHQQHRQHQGMSNEDASNAYIQHASDLLKFYGVCTHKGATDKQSNRVLLGIYEKGILVYDVTDNNEPGVLRLEITWQEIVATHSQNRKFYVVFFNDVKKDGGTVSYRFHGHGGVHAAIRMHKDCVAFKEFYYHPEKKIHRRSRSFAEADSIVRVSGAFERADAKYATTGRDLKRTKSSFGRIKSSFKRKMSRKRKVQEPEQRITESSGLDSPKKSTITYV